MVGDRKLIDASPSLGQTRRNLRFESEPIRPQRDALQKIRAHHLIARLHVGEVQVRAHVREKRQQLVADHVPKEVHPVRPSQESRSEHRVGLSLLNGAHERRQLGGIVF